MRLMTRVYGMYLIYSIYITHYDQWNDLIGGICVAKLITHYDQWNDLIGGIRVAKLMSFWGVT